MSQKHYDYIIVGNGLAGLQLALAFAKDSYFNNKSIALIDASTKTENDKTWSFWEQNNSTFNKSFISFRYKVFFPLRKPKIKWGFFLSVKLLIMRHFIFMSFETDIK